MTDLEAVKLCAEAMELAHAVGTTKIVLTDEPGVTVYWPLHDKAQCFDLVERFRLILDPYMNGGPWNVYTYATPIGEIVPDHDLARAIVTCVANMQAARRKEQ
jgi:hypothetical protein